MHNATQICFFMADTFNLKAANSVKALMQCFPILNKGCRLEAHPGNRPHALACWPAAVLLTVH